MPYKSVSTPQPVDTHGKALFLNLSGPCFGTLAEIGAGQEVARWFLTVGGASGSVAKTISAYDKTFSDEIYGAGTRYVSKERLLAMLDHEYDLLLNRLQATRGADKRFFVFADTVAARNYQGTNDQHGWLGIRFQAEPQSKPSQILVHINLRDSTAQLQQEAVGILGVNLIYATFYQRDSRETFLGGLFDNLSLERIEIDVVNLSGPAFEQQDANEWCLETLCRGMAHAIVFGDPGDAVEPSSILRKRPLLVMRGTFAHPELLDGGWFRSANAQLLSEAGRLEREPIAVVEMTTRHVSRSGGMAPAEMLRRIRAVTPRCAVIASGYPETYLLSRYLRRHSTEPIRFVMSTAAAAKVLSERFYQDLPGTLLEGLGKLLATNVKIYVAPMAREAYFDAIKDLSKAIEFTGATKAQVDLDDIIPPGAVRHLLEYLRATGRIAGLKHPGG